MENRILLLEDDVSLIDGLQYSLKKNGFDVDFVRSVQETLTYLSEIENTICSSLMSHCQTEQVLRYVKKYEKTEVRYRLFSDSF